MNERRQNMAVGLTTLLGIGGLIFLLLLFGYLPDIIRGGYLVEVELNQAPGLNPGGIVTYRGLEVGVVKKVQLKTPPAIGVVATLNINEGIKLPANVAAVLEGSVFGTNAQLALYADLWPETNGPLTLLPTDGSAVISGSSSSAVETFAELTSQIKTLSDEWTLVGRNLNALLELRDPEAVDQGDLLANASTVIIRLDQRLAELKQVMAGVDRYVNDEQLLADFKATAANTRDLTGKLSEQLPQDIAALRQRYVALADDLSAAVASAKGAIDAARQPDGTLGKMLVDPSLYDNMNDTFIRLQTAIDEMRLLVEKWKSEGLPVRF
ncbi:MAG: MCE family protein [Phycisphaeraceae bacterium]|nr:MCE family protein [Phycisphaeraceae bacterium]